jgi:hypothetical protein
MSFLLMEALGSLLPGRVTRDNEESHWPELYQFP